LDPRLREVYQLHADQHLPLATIGVMLNIPAATVATRLHRARRKLRVGLEAGDTHRSGVTTDTDCF
jgi:DNA-directed RNA polymerase specialized sigma24 family protein